MNAAFKILSSKALQKARIDISQIDAAVQIRAPISAENRSDKKHKGEL